MDNLKKYREACGLKQAEAARLLGLSSRKVLNNYEAGIRNPDLETVLKMSELYGVPSYVLLGLDENAPDAEIRGALVEQVLKMSPRQMQMLLSFLDGSRGVDFHADVSASEEELAAVKNALDVHGAAASAVSFDQSSEDRIALESSGLAVPAQSESGE